MKKSHKKILPVLSFFLIGIIGIAWIVLMPEGLNSQLQDDYVFLVIAYYLYSFFLWTLFTRYSIDLFEPIVLAAAMYFLILVFAPLVCIIRGTTSILGVNTMGGQFRSFLFL